MTKKVTIYIDEKKCIGCQMCIRACSKKAIEIIGNIAKINKEKCKILEGLCAIYCSRNCIKIKRHIN